MAGLSENRSLQGKPKRFDTLEAADTTSLGIYIRLHCMLADFSMNYH
jgi:hypothetical protein